MLDNKINFVKLNDLIYLKKKWLRKSMRCLNKGIVR